MINEKPYVKVYPNPVQGNTINLQFTNEPAGRYTLRLLSTNGQIIFSKNISHPGGNCNQPVNLPANIASAAYQIEIVNPDKARQSQMLFIKNK
ncbi:MAG: T9SS type A sorting domain-containing protein [Chitinophagaceae bacterium]|nr:T9SS type A sorting domain-containing protein [Chitinophagaceae bacterium]